ncbi:MAG: elongation factor G [Lentisphaeria bacterium]|nr:elongation factor G [Lentisphaeria bacterium]
MKSCLPGNVRNFVLAGHAGAGKTTLADLMLFKSGAVTRRGSVDQRSSVSDFRPEEQERKSSIFSSALNCPWQEHHFFFIDTPGYPDFCGEAIGAIRVADLVLIVVDAALGIGPGTIRAWQQARDFGIPRAFFINGCDRDQADYPGILDAIRHAYGTTVCIPFTVPAGEKAGLTGVTSVLGADAEGVDEIREALMDTVAESEEALMEKYLEEGALSPEEVAQGLHTSILKGAIVPIFCGSAEKDIGVAELMDGLCSLCPAPTRGAPVPCVEGELDRSSGDGLAYVFKSVTDPFIGQLTFLRVYSGTFSSDSELLNVTQGARERVGALLHINGKEQVSVDQAGPGEIIALAKLKNTRLLDVLATRTTPVRLQPPRYPQPTMSYAVFAASKGDEDKIGSGLQRLAGEDPTFRIDRNAETRQIVINGMGDQHLNLMIGRLKSEFRAEVTLETPRVPYRETVTAVGSAQYRHKKQTGGHGQFAEVHLRLEPLPEGEFEFDNEVVGGNIPKNFIPAVEKGVVEALQRGPLSGSKVINVKAVVFDGKYHAVDSSEMAFKIASRGAFRGAMAQARPIILEPIMTLKILFPDEYMGDISGDLNSRRGRILGMDREEGMQVVHAEVPLAETYTYSMQLRSITQGRGSFEMRFDRYEPVPAQIAATIQAAAQKEEEDE